MSKSHVLLAVGNENVSNILRKYINNAEHLQLINQEVMHFQYLDEIIELHDPDLLIVHDVFLPSETTGKKEREEEWLNFFHSTRQKYDNLRIVFLCERTKDDVFLNQIIGIGVLDIFNETAIDMVKFIEQLSSPARYANVAKFRGDSFATFEVSSKEQKTEGQNEVKVIEEAVRENVTSNQQDTTSVKYTQDQEKQMLSKESTATKKTVVKRNKLTSEKNEKVREKIIERLVPLPIEKKIVLIGAPFKRNGSTFVAHLLSKEIANLDINVTYIENPFDCRAYTYDRFDGNRKLNNYRSIFFSHIRHDKSSHFTNEWEENNVNIIAKHPDEEIYHEEEITFEVFIKILLKIPSPVTIIDVGSDWDKKVVQELFEIASHAFMIIEPDISDAHYLEDPANNETAYYRYLVEHEKTQIIGNRMDQSLLNNKLITELYGQKMITTIPSIHSKIVFECQDKAIFINDYKSKSKIDTKKMMQPLLQEIIPDNLLRRSNRKSKLYAKVFLK